MPPQKEPSTLETDPRTWVETTLAELNSDLFEREEAISKSLLAVLSGQSVFLYGPPGTAKSLIARRISNVFSDANYFEYLMQRFSTPEEVFGPVSIAELKNDNYVRKTENYLPEADIAFLDEIWKSSPAILNTLLTIINERKFKNGSKIEEIPLKAIIAASNEFPAPNSGLDALYDRFIMRICVDPMYKAEDFEAMLRNGEAKGDMVISSPISTETWKAISDNSSKTILSKEILSIISGIREKLAEYSEKEGSAKAYVSDRRWLKAAIVLRTAAYLSGRESVEPVDAFILKSCLWSSSDNKAVIDSIVDKSVEEYCIDYRKEYSELSSRITDLESEVKDVFSNAPKKREEPAVVNGLACLTRVVNLHSPVALNIPYGIKNVGGTYSAWDIDGNPHQFQVISVSGNETSIRFNENLKETLTIPMVFHDTDEVPQDTVNTYLRTIQNYSDDVRELASATKAAAEDKKSKSASPFVSVEESRILISSLENAVRSIDSLRCRLDRLKDTVEAYAH